MAAKKQRIFRNKELAGYPHAKLLNRAIRSNAWGKDHNFHLSYQKANGEVVSRKVKPMAAKGNVLVAFDHHRNDIRSFRLDRIQSMEKHAFWNGFERARRKHG